MPSNGRPKPPRDAKPTAIDVLERVVAHTLPPAPGTILVLTAPPQMDWGNMDWLNTLQAAAEATKQQNGFAGVIITSHGTRIESMDAAQLADIGLMAIPGAHDMPPEGE